MARPHSSLTPRPPTAEDIEAEVVGNIKAQRLGPATVGDLNLPGAFLLRVAGRIIQESFQSNFRIVVDDIGRGENVPPPVPENLALDIPTTAYSCPGVTGLAEDFGPAQPPPSRGFRPALLPGELSLAYAPQAGPGSWTQVQAQAAQRLATDGLILVASRTLEVLLRDQPGMDVEEARRLLGDVGLPTDLLACFKAPRGGDFLSWLMSEVRKGQSSEKLRKQIIKLPFEFDPAAAGYEALSESGEVTAKALRVQLTRGGFWLAPGDGGSLDMVRQVIEALPAARVLVFLEERHRGEFLRSAARWEWHPRVVESIALVTLDQPASQWAQDNGKPGHVKGKDVTLVPRFSSRGEQVSEFVSGDTFVGSALAKAGEEVLHSALLFQGGNVMVVRDPAAGERVLLLGEAEVYRNVALGLTRLQAIEALRVELGAERCVVLPAASIHIDYEVSVRTHEGKVFAFVNDCPSAARLIVGIALGALLKAAVLDEAVGRLATEVAAGQRWAQLRQLLWPILTKGAQGPGQFALSVAETLSRGESDSGVGNLHRFILALDILCSALPGSGDGMDPHLESYLRALGRQEGDRARLRASLRNLGWSVVPVPSLAQGDRSICALNGIQVSNGYLIPVYSGLYAPLDDAAARVFRGVLGMHFPVMPIRSGESQRRGGGVHCSTALLRGENPDI